MKHLRTSERNRGFTLIELLVVIGLFGLIIGIATKTFNLLLDQSTRQSKTAESQIEGIIGLELLRADIEHAGLGLPWSFPKRDGSGVLVNLSYPEAGALDYDSLATKKANFFNIPPPQPPQPLMMEKGVGAYGSDILVLRGVSLARSEASQRWSYVTAESPSTPKSWGSEESKDIDNLKDNERIIVLRPEAGGADPKQLVMVAANAYFTKYSATSFPSTFAPTGPGEHFLVYGVDPDTDLSMPFNRADYFISSANVPRFCSPKTGVLEKGILNHNGTSAVATMTRLPLLDCVADMKVMFRRVNAGGTLDAATDTLAGLTPDQIREIREVTVFVLTHEGQMDRNFSFPDKTVTYQGYPGGFAFDLESKIGGNWQKYRWKLYRVTVKPKNLG